MSADIQAGWCLSEQLQNRGMGRKSKLNLPSGKEWSFFGK